MASPDAVIDMALSRLRGDAKDSYGLLGLCANYRTDQIPVALLTIASLEPEAAARELGGIEGMAWLRDLRRVRNALDHSASLGLLSHSAASFSIHESVAGRVRGQATEQQAAEWMDSAAFLLSTAMPVDVTDAAAWPVIIELLPHVSSLLRVAKENDFAHGTLGKIALLAGQFLLLDGLPGEAKKLAELALSLGIPDGDMEESLENVLAAAYAELGQPYEALGILEQVVRRSQESSRWVSARTLTNYGTTLFRLRRLDEAAVILRDAVTQWRQLGVKLELANAAANLGLVLRDIGLLAEAEANLRLALSVREEMGTSYSEYAIADDYGNLATVLHEQGDLPGALELHQSALSLHGQILRETHPAIARDLANLANVLIEMDRLEDAQAYLQRALRIFDLEFGPEHPDSIRTRELLAVVQGYM